MGYHFVRGDMPNPIWDELRAIPFGMLPFLILAVFVLIPPQSEFSGLSLVEDVDAPSGYRVSNHSAKDIDDIECAVIPLTEDQRSMCPSRRWESMLRELRIQYMRRRARWNNEEWSWLINAMWNINDISDPNLEKFYIPVVDPDCDSE